MGRNTTKGTNATTKKGENSSYVVAKAFSDNPTIQPNRSIANRYAIGDDVSHLDADRLAHLESLGYVKQTEAEDLPTIPAAPTTPTSPDGIGDDSSNNAAGNEGEKGGDAVKDGDDKE